jgi:cAMP phosphodiesterase
MPAGTNVIDSLPYKAQMKFSHAKSLSTEASKAAYNAWVANNEEKRAQNAIKLAYEALNTYYITGESLDHPAKSDFLNDQYFKAKDDFKKINNKAA